MLKDEYLTMADPAYMQKQTKLTESERSITVVKLTEVCSKFKLKDETIFLTVKLMDRYLS